MSDSDFEEYIEKYECVECYKMTEQYCELCGDYRCEDCEEYFNCSDCNNRICYEECLTVCSQNDNYGEHKELCKLCGCIKCSMCNTLLEETCSQCIYEYQCLLGACAICEKCLKEYRDLKKIKEEHDLLLKKHEKIKKENELMRKELLYRPGGEGFDYANTHFSFILNNSKDNEDNEECSKLH